MKNEYGRVFVDLHFIESENNILFSSGIALKTTIAYYYRFVMMAPPLSDWKGINGTIAKIRKALHLLSSSRNTISRIIINININSIAKNEEDIPYTGPRYTKPDVGRKVVIKPNTIEETIVANCVKDGIGYCTITLLVNQHHKEEGQEIIERNAIMSIVQLLEPVVTKMGKCL